MVYEGENLEFFQVPEHIIMEGELGIFSSPMSFIQRKLNFFSAKGYKLVKTRLALPAQNLLFKIRPSHGLYQDTFIKGESSEFFQVPEQIWVV